MQGSLALTLLTLLAVIPAVASAQAPSADVKDAIARADADWPTRDQPGKLEAMRASLEAAERAAPDDYGVLWRLSRLYFWLSDDPALSDDEKSKLGKKGWELGDRATAANPKGVEGWFYAAGGMGNYSLGIGILKALGEGIEGKFKDRLSRAEKFDPKFFDGGI